MSDQPWRTSARECVLPRRAGGVTSRGDTRDWSFKAIAQSQNIKTIIFTWNGWVNCGIDCWFCCKSLFWLSILSKLIFVLVRVVRCSLVFVQNVRFTLLFSNFIFWEVCSCEVRFFVLSSTNPEFHEHENGGSNSLSALAVMSHRARVVSHRAIIILSPASYLESLLDQIRQRLIVVVLPKELDRSISKILDSYHTGDVTSLLELIAKWKLLLDLTQCPF